MSVMWNGSKFYCGLGKNQRRTYQGKTKSSNSQRKFHKSTDDYTYPISQVVLNIQNSIHNPTFNYFIHHIFINSLKQTHVYIFQFTKDKYQTDFTFILGCASEKIQNSNFLRNQEAQWKGLGTEVFDNYTSIWKDLIKLIRDKGLLLINF